jgi:hypothetical protein
VRFASRERQLKGRLCIRARVIKQKGEKKLVLVTAVNECEFEVASLFPSDGSQRQTAVVQGHPETALAHKADPIGARSSQHASSDCAPLSTPVGHKSNTEAGSTLDTGHWTPDTRLRNILSSRCSATRCLLDYAACVSVCACPRSRTNVTHTNHFGFRQILDL